MGKDVMRVLAFNASPRMRRGNTALILTPFLEGMEEAGAQVELIYVKKLRLNPCQGCFICWLKTPGVCFQHDDMQMLHPKLREADVWVFATPVYVDGPVGPLKNLVDRLIPLILPYFELREGHCRHVVPPGYNHGKVVLVANSGFWERDNFDPLVMWMRAVCKNVAREFAGALLRPHGEAMRPLMKRGASLDDVFEAARDAGRQLVRKGAMARETLDAVARDLLPLETYVEQLNRSFARTLEQTKMQSTEEEPA